MGKIIFWMGIAGIVISLLMLLLGWLFYDTFLIFFFFLGFPILMLSLPVAALGLILWLCLTKEKGKQIGGFILILMGPVGYLISYALYKAAQHSTEDIPQYGYGFIGFVIGSISSIFLIAGIILFFVGIGQARKRNLATISYKKAVAVLSLIIIICISVYVVISQEHTYHNPCGEGYFPAANNHSVCCQSGSPYYWSSDGICHNALPPTPTASPTPTDTPIPTYTLRIIYASAGGFTIPGEGTYQYSCGTSVELSY